MTESEGYERIGRLSHRVEQAEAAFNAVLDTLAKVVSGEICRSRVMVDLTNRGVTWAPEGMRPETPATINGLPKCVVAPADDATQATVDMQRAAIEKLEADLKELHDEIKARGFTP